MKQLRVIAYPHSTLTTNPKIPDGSETSSIGVRKHMFQAITLPTGSSRFFVALQPSLMTPLIVGVGNGTTLVGDVTRFDTGIQSGLLSNGAGASADIQTTPISKWRLVSLGLRIRNTNNDTEDSGSWHAIRRQTNIDGAAHRVFTDGSGVNILGIAETTANVTGAPPIAGYSEKPSFVSGLVKDLGRHYFRLVDTSPNVHPFKIVDSSHKITFTTNLGAGYLTLTNDQHSNDWFERTIDENMDSIKLVIDGADGKTSLLFDLVANYEYVPFPSDSSTRFMDECAFAPDMFRRVRNALRIKHSKA